MACLQASAHRLKFPKEYLAKVVAFANFFFARICAALDQMLTSY